MIEVNKPVELKHLSLQELMVFPNLSRTMPYPGSCGGNYYAFEGEKVCSFSEACYSLRLPWGSFINRSEFNDFPKWTILSNPNLAGIKWTNDKKIEMLTPVAVMVVTENGDNAVNVYLPLGECCSCKKSYIDKKGESKEYICGGKYRWEERPFVYIMNALKQRGKIVYFHYEDRECLIMTKAGNGCMKGWDFRIL